VEPQAVLRQRAKVNLVHDEELNKLLPVRVAIVEIELADGSRLSERVTAVRGTPRNQWKELTQPYIELVGLAGFEAMYPYQLSGGMQQRAGLARALVLNPQVLLMDEPFGALDAQTRELLQEELVRILEQEQRTLVFITHSIDEAIVLGDRIVVMSTRPGRVREVLEVDLPRPRSVQEARNSPRYAELRQHIWEELRPEVGLVGAR